MTETAKTVLFAAAAALSLMIAFAMGPSNVSDNLDDLLGERLNQFEVDVAKRLKIVKFDKETASKREFEVAEKDGLWTIPSKQSYPADAARQMGEAATCLIDREVLRVAAKNALQHVELGVIDPSTSKLDSKSEGVGTRVTITDSNEASLADMIIGKAVKDAEGQYYVRNANQGRCLCGESRPRETLHEVRRLDRRRPAETQPHGYPTGAHSKTIPRSCKSS